MPGISINPSSRSIAIALACLALAGCVNTQTAAFPVGQRRQAKPPGASVLVFKDSLPDGKHEVVARLNVHIEKTFLIPSAFDEALPLLEKLAREHGADALIDFEEKRSRLNETFIYNVKATAIAFVANP